MTIVQRSKILLISALPVIVLVFFVTASSHFAYTPDGTYIYLQYTRNFIHGHGIAFNAGEPSYGFASPLWLFIISAGGVIGVDLYLAAKGIDLIFASLALIVFYLLAYEVIRDIPVSIIATVAFSVHACFLCWGGTGVEFSLTLLLLLATLLFCLRNEYLLATVFAALLTLAQPMAFFIIGLIVLDVYMNSVDKGRAYQMGIALLILFVSFIAPWLWYAYTTFGTIFPNTVYTKAGFYFNINESLIKLIDILKTLIGTDGVVVAVLIIGGLLLIRFKPRLDETAEVTPYSKFFLIRNSYLGIGWIILLSLITLLTHAYGVSRLVLLFTPILIILSYLFLSHLVVVLMKERIAYLLLFLFTAGIILQNQFFYHEFIRPSMRVFIYKMDESLVPIGKWLKEHTPQNAIILAQDIGAVGYYSGRKIYNVSGSVAPEVSLPFPRGCSEREVWKDDILKNPSRPDYLVYCSYKPEELKGKSTLTPLFTKSFLSGELDDSELNFYTVYKIEHSSSTIEEEKY